MRKQTLAVAATIFLGAGACGGSKVITGIRADGLTVECVAQQDDVSTCTPLDGDNACESWEDGGAATVLWPPNHALIQFTLADCGAVQPGCENDGGSVIVFRAAPVAAAVPEDAVITSITADEPVEVRAAGDGSTADLDIAIVDDVTFELRSERQGGGDGRVYRVHYVDGAGVTGACEFLVPHDQRPTSGAVDSGTAVTVTR